MDTFLEHIFRIFGNLGSFPYKTIKPGKFEDGEILLSKGARHTFWCLTAFVQVFHMSKTIAYLILFGKQYLIAGEVLRLVFHIFWLAAHTSMASNHIVFIFHQSDVVELVNGTIRLTKYYQRSNSIQFIFKF